MRLGQFHNPMLLTMPKGVVQQGLALLVARVVGRQRLGDQGGDLGLAPGRPGNRLELQKSVADGAGLLLFALELQAACFLGPLLPAGRLHGLWAGLAQAQPQQAKQGVGMVGLNQRECLHGTRHRHIQGVDIKLVQLA